MLESASCCVAAPLLREEGRCSAVVYERRMRGEGMGVVEATDCRRLAVVVTYLDRKERE